MTMDHAATKSDVTKFYDVADIVLTTIWGRNFHVGYWDSDDDDASNAEAVQRLNDLLIEKLAVSSEQRVLDVGSGLGEPAFRLVELTGATVLGVTVAQPQVDEANQRARELGLADRVSFENADGLALPYSDASFDAAWAIESFIHMDRSRALGEIARVLRPGGRVVITDLVQRDHPTDDTEEARSEMLDSMVLTEMPTLDGYRRMIRDAELDEVELLDLTEHTKKTNERMAKAARQHYDELVAQRGQEAADVLTMMMNSIDLGYVVAVARRPEATA